MRILYNRSAKLDFVRITRHSIKKHGADAAERYSALIELAVAAIARDPFIVGSAVVDADPQTRTYPIRLRKNDMPRGARVAKPRHVILYRPLEDDGVEILAVLHDKMLPDKAVLRFKPAIERE